MEGVSFADLLQAPAVISLVWLFWQYTKTDRDDRRARELADRELLEKDIASRNALAAALATLKQAIDNAGDRS